VYPVIFAFSRGPERFAASDLAIPLLGAVAAALALWAVLGWLMKDAQRSALVVSLAAFLFTSTGFVGRSAPDGYESAAAATWIVLGLVGGALLVRLGPGLRVATRAANAVGAVLVAIPLAQIAAYAIETAGTPRPTLGRQVPPPPRGPSGPLPDIYFIVLDAYARADVLAQVYGHDNSEFLEHLTERGFRVAEGASSNYGQTDLSLASTLNLDYLDALVDQLGAGSDDHRPLHELIENGWLRNFLAERGYTFLAFDSGYPAARIETADVTLAPERALNSFRNELSNVTPLADLRRDRDARQLFDLFRERILFILEGLSRVPALGHAPVFTFAHIESPHPPFVFGPSGEKRYPGKRFHDHDGDWLIKKGGLTVSQYRARYRDQVVFLNRALRRAIDALLEASPTPPVILLMGDHGPRSGLVWNDVDATDHWEALGILSAYHLPGASDDLVYPELSPVNAFRLVLDHYFGTELGLLEDRNYFSTARRPYDFVDVTESIRATRDARERRARLRSGS
jgi:hypothetical protein